MAFHCVLALLLVYLFFTAVRAEVRSHALDTNHADNRENAVSANDEPDTAFQDSERRREIRKEEISRMSKKKYRENRMLPGNG